MKGFVAGFLVCSLLSATVAFAAGGVMKEVFYGINVMVDGVPITFADDMTPFIMDGRTFLPLRAVGESFAAGGVMKEVFYGINVVVDGVPMTFTDDMTPFITDGRTYLPLRALGEALGKPVDYNSNTKTAYVGKKPEAPASSNSAPANQEASSTALYGKYYDILKNAIDKYGVVDDSSDASKWRTGLQYAGLIDFGNGSPPSLLYVYRDEFYHSPYGRTCLVYGYKDGEIVQYADLYDGPGADHYNDAQIVNAKNGMKYISYWGGRHPGYEYFTVKNGEWVSVLKGYHDFDYDEWVVTGYIVNDKEVSEDIYDNAPEKELGVTDNHQIPIDAEAVYNTLNELSRMK